MHRFLTGAIGCSLALASLGGSASAQTPNGISTNADGSYVTSRAGLNPTADGGGGTVIYGDITTGPGYTVIGAPSVETSPAPADPAPDSGSDGSAVPGDTFVPEDTGVAPDEMATADGPGTAGSETDLDADNIADNREWDLGLDPGNADTDGDGVADGDEITIYSTDPLNGDSDGDGLTDGEELFGVLTDPLVWNEPAAQPDQSLAQDAAAGNVEDATPAATDKAVSLAQGTIQDVTATDGNAATLGNGDASAAPGTVTRPGGTTQLGPDGTYVVSDAPSNVVITGDTDVIAPLNPSSPADPAPDAGAAYACDAYGSWYDAQVAYENAGATAADPAMVQALDPDYDGIACEESMA
ncbi:MAG: hypothetical protein KC442_17055 [Thermomicrobiales bacterium]|nr:hypothetical protein [Thermomicrobiales bacterium]